MKDCGCDIGREYSHGHYNTELERSVGLELKGLKTTCPPEIPIWGIVLLSVAGGIIVILIGILIWMNRPKDDYEQLN